MGKYFDRHSIRLPQHDYSGPGAYFVTLITYERECLFGAIIDGRIELSLLGRIVEEQWWRLPARFHNWSADSFGIMPNHVHGVLIKRNGVRESAAKMSRPVDHKGLLRPFAPHTPDSDSLGALIRAFKSAVTLRWHFAGTVEEQPLWQRNYYEQIVRGGDDLERIRHYIIVNPLRWTKDGANPDRAGPRQRL